VYTGYSGGALHKDAHVSDGKQQATRRRNFRARGIMDNKELNQKLEAICGESKKYDYECFGGKTIPFFGWFWRLVAFDEDFCLFGIVEEDGRRMVGFDESGKDFEQVGAVRASGDTWQEIKRLVVEAAHNPSASTLRAVNDAIQGLGRASGCDVLPPSV
jgi:hypothetical protein